MRIAVLMDTIEKTYPGETTHFIGRELARRGHELEYCTPRDLAYEAPRVTATARRMSYTREVPVTDGEPQRGVGLGCTLAAPRVLDLGTMDVVLMRQDPPVDETYLAATYLLERLAPRTLVVNEPRAVRDTAEKLSLVHFPELAPPTMVTSDPARLRAFREQHGDLVIKRLFGKGGEGLFFVKHDDKNWNVIVELVGTTPVMAQKYFDLPSKKVVVIEGTPVGAVQIEPEPDDIRCNLDRGKTVHRVELSTEETAAVAQVARFLGERGILFGVIDLLGPYVIETNVTSPGIAYYFNSLFEQRLEVLIVDAIEARCRSR
jgi:glutathione synthase